LTHRHFNLAKQRHNLLRAEPLLRHDQLLSKTVSLKPPGTKRPGQVNVTGLSEQARDLASKRLGLLREVILAVHRLAILTDLGYPASMREMSEVRTVARTLGFEVTRLEIRQAENIAPAFEVLTDRADALYVCSGPLMSTNRLRINTLALAARLPTISSLRENVEAGGLMSYGANLSDLFRRAAEYVDMILRGAKPGDLPIEQPTKYELAINLITAKAIGLTVPESFLLRADEVIE
jgi:putative ABC transport system substrate-binding protein